VTPAFTREPRTARARGAEPPAPARRQPNRGFRRLVALLAIAALLTAAVAVALILASGTSSTVVHVRTIISHDVSSAVKSVQDLINQNTK